MKNWTIRRRINAGFAAVVAITAAIVIFASYRLVMIQRQADIVEVTLIPAMTKLSEIESNLDENMALALHHLITETPAERARLEKEIRDREALNGKLEAEFERLAAAEIRPLVEKRKPLDAAYVEALNQVLALSGADKDKEARGMVETNLEPAFVALDNVLREELAAVRGDADAANKAIHTLVQSTQLWVLVCLAGGMLLSLYVAASVARAVNTPMGKLLGLFEELRKGDFTKRLALGTHDEFGVLGEGINRTMDDLTELVGKVQKSGIQVNTSVTEIAATAKEQQSTANEIAATTAEIGATSKEISATAKELVKTTGEVTSVAEETAGLAGKAQAGLARMGDTVQQIVTAAGAISAKLAVVNEKAGNINQVVSTINKVADQTNLLSLNAAIEAEKAGEYGRGFAVVATEIRRLADQTAVATYDIEQTVKEMQSAVAAGVMGMDKFSEEVRRGVEDVRAASAQLSQIIQQVQTLTPRFEAVNEGMQSQSTGAQQISEALLQLGEATRQTVESLRQSNLAIEQLNEAATGLRNGVSRFKVQM